MKQARGEPNPVSAQEFWKSMLHYVEDGEKDIHWGWLAGTRILCYILLLLALREIC